MSEQDEPTGDYEDALALQARAKDKLARVTKRTPELHALARRLDGWGKANHLAPKIYDALRGQG